MIRKAAVLLGFLALAACGKPDNAPGPGGVTVGEAKALDDAAAMIEKEALPPSDIPTVAAKKP